MSARTSVGDVEDRKSEPQFQEEIEDFLTLRLCSNYHNGDKSSGLSSATKAQSEVGESRFSASDGLDWGLGLGLSLGAGVGVGVEPSRRRRRQREFICKFCDKNFNSGQSLGGHLNAHRGERDLIRKIDEEMGFPSSLGQLTQLATPPNSPTANHHGAQMAPAAGAMSPPRHRHGSYGTAAPPPTVNGAAEKKQMEQACSAAGEGEEQNLDLSLSL